MKKIIYSSFLVGTLMIANTGCKKSLDLTAPDLITDDKAFTNVASLERGIVGAYAQYNASTFDNEVYANALYTDEATLPTENTTGRGVIAYRWQTDPGNAEVTSQWAAHYFAIDRANRILAAIDAIPAPTPQDVTNKNRIKGEALALRAFGHLQLLINFADGYNPTSLGVPYMEKSVVGKPSRNTVAEVFAKLKADLAAAVTLIPATGLPSTFTNRARITLPAVYAIQARAALYDKKWDDAIAAATLAINAVPLATIAQYPGIWTDASSTEVIWKLKRVSGETRIGDIFWDRGQSIVVYGVSEKLRNQFNTATDIRYASLVRLRGAGRFSLGKYIGGDPLIPNLADCKIFRTAEMYLIRAEAYAEKDQLASAAADVNALLTQRITGYTNQTFATKADAINAIMNERFKELAFEGHRMNDLRRRLLPVNRLAADAINAQGAVNLLPTSPVYNWPIPNSEILANENMVQNKGY